MNYQTPNKNILNRIENKHQHNSSSSNHKKTFYTPETKQSNSFYYNSINLKQKSTSHKFYQIQQQQKFKINTQQCQAISISKYFKKNTKKGISLVKNLSNQQYQTLQSIINAQEIKKLTIKNYQNQQKYYYYYHLMTILSKLLKFDNINKVRCISKIDKFSFSKILLKQGLVNDEVKQRYLISRIWGQLKQFSKNSIHQFEDKIGSMHLYAFLLSVLGYPINYLKVLEKINYFNETEKSKTLQIYNFFKDKYSDLRLKKISQPLDINCK